MDTNEAMDAAPDVLQTLGRLCWENAVKHGFWSGDNSTPNDLAMLGKLMLIVTEVAEVAEAIRNERPKVEIAEEFADILIRVLDISYGWGIDLGEATLRKMAVNAGRPLKHGKTC